MSDPDPRPSSPSSAWDYVTYVVVVLLLAAAGAFLYNTVAESRSMFGRGIQLAEQTLSASRPELATHEIFVLSLAHQVVAFKATALFVGAMIAVLGGLFVLRTSEVRYDLSAAGAGWKLSLGTSSPGLVMISLGCALVAVAVVSKVAVQNEVPILAPIAPAHAPNPSADQPELSGADYVDLAQKLMVKDAAVSAPEPPDKGE